MSVIPGRLTALRQKMVDNNIDFYIIPSTDPHMSEYVAPCWLDREYMSGFDGSAGLLVVSATEAALWTDSRYYIQATEQLHGTGIDMMQLQNRYRPEYIDWIISKANVGDTVGAHGMDLSVTLVEQYQDLLDGYCNLNLNIDLVSDIYTNRPPLPSSPIHLHTKHRLASSEKIADVRSWMSDNEVNGYLVTALDEIAWLLNIRGSDVDYNPVVISYLYITPTSITLYLHDSVSRLQTGVNTHFLDLGVTVVPYNITGIVLPENNIAVDLNKCNYSVYNMLGSKAHHFPSYIEELKAIKNEDMVEEIRDVMIKDGVALCKAFYWLEEQLATGQPIKESDFAARIAADRATQTGYKGESFPAIVGYQENGAVIHYHADADTALTILQEGILLCDSGGQYEGGTTDITRTISLQSSTSLPPTTEQKRNYTAVLKGFIALSSIKFPKGVTGAQLDLMARQYLWKDGLDYGHGTGHGVGYYLNVHEGPHGIGSISSSRSLIPFEEGFIVTNEPGYYEQGEYGIRIENILYCREDSNHPDFLVFEDLTLFPIDTSLIEVSLLSDSDINWINSYHTTVLQRLSPHINDQNLIDWLTAKCEHITLL